MEDQTAIGTVPSSMNSDTEPSSSNCIGKPSNSSTRLNKPPQWLQKEDIHKRLRMHLEDMQDPKSTWNARVTNIIANRDSAVLVSTQLLAAYNEKAVTPEQWSKLEEWATKGDSSNRTIKASRDSGPLFSSRSVLATGNGSNPVALPLVTGNGCSSPSAGVKRLLGDRNDGGK